MSSTARRRSGGRRRRPSCAPCTPPRPSLDHGPRRARPRRRGRPERRAKRRRLGRGPPPAPGASRLAPAAATVKPPAGSPPSRRAPAWFRRRRGPAATLPPSAIPIATADERRLAPVVDVETEDLAEERLVRGRDEQRVTERAEALGGTQAARATGPASCRGRSPRRRRSARPGCPHPRRTGARREELAHGRRPRRRRPGSGSRTLGASRMCVATTDAPASAAAGRYSGSAKPLMSFPRTAPSRYDSRATDARQVSTEMGRSKVLWRTATVPTTRSSSSASVTSGPGPAFTPPTSSTSAPSATSPSALGEQIVEHERLAPVVERVGCAVEDPHDHAPASTGRTTVA